MHGILLNATGLDSSHRYRGIGRYVRGLIAGFAALRAKPAEGAGLNITLIRLHPQREPHPVFGKPAVLRRYFRVAEFESWLENCVRLRRDLTRIGRGAALYHSTEPYGHAPWLGPHLCSVATCHDLIPILFPRLYSQVPSRFYFAWAKRAYRRVNGVIAISEAVKRSLVEKFGVPAKNIAVVHHGVEACFFEDPGIEAPYPGGRYFFYAGGLDQRKRIDLILSSFAAVKNDVAEHLVLCGHWDARDTMRLGKTANDLGIGDRVHRLEYVTDRQVIALYRGATAFLFPSLYEGFGLPVLEAQAAGCPVITNRLSALPEVGKDAVLYLDDMGEGGDVERMGSALKRLSTDGDLRRELISAGVKNARAFTWEETARKTKDVYLRLLAGRPASGD